MLQTAGTKIYQRQERAQRLSDLNEDSANWGKTEMKAEEFSASSILLDLSQWEKK